VRQPTLVSDGGIENCNSAVNRMIESGMLIWTVSKLASWSTATMATAALTVGTQR
jgi:hypothetical protein